MKKRSQHSVIALAFGDDVQRRWSYRGLLMLQRAQRRGTNGSLFLPENFVRETTLLLERYSMQRRSVDRLNSVACWAVARALQTIWFRPILRQRELEFAQQGVVIPSLPRREKKRRR